MADDRDSQPSIEPIAFCGPDAYISALSRDSSEVHRLVLFPVHREYLSVQVLFHAVPVPDLKVQFCASDGAKLEGELRTDETGRAALPKKVPAGNYVCNIEQQEPALISTVMSPSDPYVVVLPVGRPYADLLERVEFTRAAPLKAKEKR